MLCHEARLTDPHASVSAFHSTLLRYNDNALLALMVMVPTHTQYFSLTYSLHNEITSFPLGKAQNVCVEALFQNRVPVLACHVIQTR